MATLRSQILASAYTSPLMGTQADVPQLELAKACGEHWPHAGMYSLMICSLLVLDLQINIVSVFFLRLCSCAFLKM